MEDSDIFFAFSTACWFFISGIASYHLRKEERNIGLMKEACQLTPTQLKQNLKKDITVLKTFTQISQNKAKGMVFLDGKVHSNSPLISPLDKSNQLIASFIIQFQTKEEDQ